MTIGDYIKQLRESRDMTQRQLALKAGMSNSALSRLENNQYKPSTVTLSALSQALNVDIKKLINIYIGKEADIYSLDEFRKISTVQIPIVGTVKAGFPVLAVENIEGYLAVDRNNLAPGKEYYSLRISGDSMDKEFKQGSLVVIEKTENVKDGDIAVVAINGYEATIKRIQFKGSGVILFPMSNNPNHEPTFYDMKEDEVHILGKLRIAMTIY